LKLHNILYGYSGGWKKKIEQFLSLIPIMNPHAKPVQHWNQFFVISCLISIFIDPLFFFLLSVEQVIVTSFSVNVRSVSMLLICIQLLHFISQSCCDVNKI
jgi:cyclic nucleotide gated channel